MSPQSWFKLSESYSRSLDTSELWIYIGDDFCYYYYYFTIQERTLFKGGQYSFLGVLLFWQFCCGHYSREDSIEVRAPIWGNTVFITKLQLKTYFICVYLLTFTNFKRLYAHLLAKSWKYLQDKQLFLDMLYWQAWKHLDIMLL